MFNNTKRRLPILAALAATGLMAACASHGPGRGGPPPGGGGGDDMRRPPDTQEGGDIARPIALLLTGMNTDDNYAISRDELKAGLAKEWSLMTANGASTVSAIVFELWSLQALGARSTLPGRISFDTNLDGVITQEEFEARMTIEFDEKDKNRDGFVTRAELLTSLPSRGFQQGPGSGGGGGRPQGGGGGPGGGGSPPPR